MGPDPTRPGKVPDKAEQNITYLRQLLGEMRIIANNEGADMLRYLIEMAYVEAGDILSGLRPLSIRRQRDTSIGVTFKTAGKVKF